MACPVTSTDQPVLISGPLSLWWQAIFTAGPWCLRLPVFGSVCWWPDCTVWSFAHIDRGITEAATGLQLLSVRFHPDVSHHRNRNYHRNKTTLTRDKISQLIFVYSRFFNVGSYICRYENRDRRTEFALCCLKFFSSLFFVGCARIIRL